MRVNRLVTSVLLSAATLVTGAAVAHAAAPPPALRPLTGGQHSCSNTNPEYTVSDYNVRLYHTPGHVQFTAVHTGASWWQDAYLVTGFNRGSSAQVLCGHYGSNYAYQLPIRADAPVSISGSMRYRAYGVTGRAGWDIWMTYRGTEYTETSASAMERDHRTVEIMVQPGTNGRIASIHGSSGRWHIVYIAGGNLSRVNLTALVNKSLRALGHSPSRYYYSAIDGGVEFTHGTFSMLSYYLNISTSVTEKRSATATATFTARNGRYAITATRRATVHVTRTVTLPVKGAPLGVVRAIAARSAASEATSSARSKAPFAARSAARSAATYAMFVKLHPYRKLPNVRHKRLGTAISVLRRNGFRNLRWTRHLRPSAVVIWEAGHPGRQTKVTALIILRAKRA